MSIRSVSSQLLVSTLALSGLCSGQNTGKFNFLTYNVAGLPEIINGNDVPGDKKTNSNLIGTVLATQAYDIVHMQEDFNYHAYIYATDNHPHRTPTSGGVPFGDGLNTVANYPWTGLTRKKWNKCNLNSGDCLTPKGFSFMRMTIGQIEVDLYNLHGDAGSDQGDVDARSAGIDQILEYIKSNSNGRAVIIGGDTNDRWTNSGRSINKLTDAGFQDAWVQVIQGGKYPTAGATANPCQVPAADNKCEIVDKVFYRSGSSVKLTATSFNYVSKIFVQPDGNILSDHNPVLVDFTYTS
ncbi:endonuclease exonuclease phosphatase family [Fusarium longipes]|uniref:Endonuclease exonuclease phosphatase family n=1 Tax=Fusarium longipes TaxID=694270 RepID=A0A395SW89_9HYPO|nr:endonuclease exonuclease phosphatase family [Fusarium longipes]